MFYRWDVVSIPTLENLTVLEMDITALYPPLLGDLAKGALIYLGDVSIVLAF